MKVSRRKVSKKGRALMRHNAATDERGYMLPPPNRADLSREIVNEPTYDYKRI